MRRGSTGVAVLGRSLGAFTSQMLAGLRLFAGCAEGWRHPEVTTVILLSPQGSGDRGRAENSWKDVTIPWIAISSAGDRGPHGEGQTWRREPYFRTSTHFKHAVVHNSDHFLGAIHVPEEDRVDTVGGRCQPSTAVRRAVLAFLLAFLEALRGNAKAIAWLASHPLASQVDHECAA